MSEQHYNALPSGYQLFEYEIESVLGHGGFGITYLAWDRNLDKKVAIKEYLPAEFAVRQGPQSVRPRSTSDEGDYRWGLERFVKEAQTLALFRHPSIVPVYRFFESNGTAYMVMEYQKGQSLAELIRAHAGHFTEQELLSLMFPLLDGLAEVHKAGYLHRDVKPGNIFIREDGIPVLLDFGAARDAVGRKSKNLTSIVTPGYAPLEQYYADGNQGPWTDIYALAAIVHQAITGRIPPEAPARVKRDPYEPLVRVAAGKYNAPFLAAIDRGLAVDEAMRPQTTGAWREMLLGRAPVASPAAAAEAPAVSTRIAGDPATMVTHDAPSGRISQAGQARTNRAPRVSAPIAIAEPEPKRGNGKLMAIIAGVVLLVGVGGAGAWYVVNNGDKLGLSTSNNDSRTATNTAADDARLRAEQERARAAEKEKQRLAEQEKLRQADLEKQRLAEQDKQEKLRGAERQRQAELEKQRQAELEKQRQAEQEKQRLAEAEKLRQAELERQRGTSDAEYERRQDEQRRQDDLRRQEDARRRADEDKRRLDDERGRQAEVERQRQAEAERQRTAEQDRLRREDEDRRRQTDSDRQRQADAERQRQVEVERQRQLEADRLRREDEERRRRQEASRPTVMCPNSLAQLNSLYAPTDCLWVQRVFTATLSEQQIGVTSRWSNSRSGNTGTITVISTVQGPAGQNCRRFRQTVTSSGQTREAVGMACVGPNNAWVIGG